MNEENKKTATTVIDTAVAKAEIEAHIEEVLDRLRPFLQREGGNIELDHFDDNDTFEVVILDEVPEVKHVELIQPKQDSLEDLLQRLKDEEQAQKELDEYNKTHNNNNQ